MIDTRWPGMTRSTTDSLTATCTSISDKSGKIEERLSLPDCHAFINQNCLPTADCALCNRTEHHHGAREWCIGRLAFEQLESFKLPLQAEGFVPEAGFRGFDLSLKVLLGLREA